MRFAADEWLWGVLVSLILGGIFVMQALRSSRDREKFGQEERIKELFTARTGIRRAVSATLVCLAVASAFVAAAQPQYGRGTRVLPATNLDVVLVLDFSKSMYARDISPSRIGRAKVEVARLVRELGGARFGAVAFAGESISFPLTSDGAAIAQFFRGLEPNDMPLGGTAIARALESGRQLLERDPLSKNHERVIILITDGEDLEGDPVEVAKTIRQSGIRVEVVQIGGQSPEPIPEVGDDGVVRGMRHDAQGQIMTTALSPEGEAQLAAVAAEGDGQVVRAASGQVGVDEMSARLRRLMTEELSERVETVYADVFQYPLVFAVLLLMAEVWVGTARRRVIEKEPPLGGRRRRRRMARMKHAALLLAFFGLGCEQGDRLFERNSPVVEEAIAALQEKDYKNATELLTGYLETGPCEAGVIGVGERARQYSDASYDLALVFSGASQKQVPEAQAPSPSANSGQSSGQVVPPAGTALPGAAPSMPGSNEADAELSAQVDCALRLLAPLGPRTDLPVALRARSYYLAGNLELRRAGFEAAVNFYDSAIVLAPGVPEGEGDPIGLMIAYNRALALRLLKEKEEQEEEQKSDQNEEQDSEDEQSDDESDSSEEQDQDKEEENDESDSENEEEQEDSDESQGEDDKPQDQDSEEGEQDEEQSKQQDSQEGEDSEQPDQPQEQQAPQQPEQTQQDSAQAEQARDERMLDLLEQAPTLQQHDAQQKQGQRVRGRATMEDK